MTGEESPDELGRAEVAGDPADRRRGQRAGSPRPDVVEAMKLYVIRHATAQAAVEAADLYRQLTPAGRRQAREAGRALRDRGGSPLRLLSSPAARARETAELIAVELEPVPEVEFLETLYSGPSLESLLPAVGDSPEVALVGHQPFVEHLVRGLLSHPADLRFPPGVVCCLEFESGLRSEGGRLAWVLSP